MYKRILYVLSLLLLCSVHCLTLDAAETISGVEVEGYGFDELPRVSILSVDDSSLANGDIRVESRRYYTWKNPMAYTHAQDITAEDGYSSVNYTNNLWDFEHWNNLQEAQWFRFSSLSGEMLGEKGFFVDLGITNIQFYLSCQEWNDNTSAWEWKPYKFDPSKISSVKVKFIGFDGESKILDAEDFELTACDNGYSFSLTTPELPFDTYKIEIFFYYKLVAAFNSSFDVHHDHTICKFYYGYNNSYFTCEEADVQKGIFGIVKNMYNLVKKKLPQYIGDAIGNTIKSLFVPSQAEFESYFNKWEELLELRFGALYQVVDIIRGFFEEINTDVQQGTIRFPYIELKFGDTVFPFGGWDVKVIPDGFDFLVEAVKLAIDMVCTIGFISALKRKYDKIVEEH